MSEAIEAIFNAIPVEGDTSSPKDSNKPEFKKEQGDRVKNGNTNARIAAFGDLVEDDEYGENNQKGYEPVKIEKDKTPVSKEEPKDKEKKDEQKPEDKKQQVEEKPVVAAPEKIKVKADGVEEELTLEELKSEYSGKKAGVRMINEANVIKKKAESELKQSRADVQHIQNEVNELRSSFDTVIGEYKKNGFTTKNPMKFVEDFIDRLGLNSHDFSRAMFEHNLKEYAQFFEMDEHQQDAFFVKRENDYLRKKEQTLTERTTKAQSETERQKKEFNLIKSAGLTVDVYNELFDELDALGDKEITPEKVVEFAKIKPIIDRAGSIVAKTSKRGDVDLINKVSDLLLQFPNTTEEEIMSEIDGSAHGQRLAENLKGKEDFSVKTKNKPAYRKDDNVQFDEEEMAFFKSIRR